MSLRVLCDRCGFISEPRDAKTVGHKDHNEGMSYYTDFDLCKSCFQKFKTFMKDPTYEVEEALI